MTYEDFYKELIELRNKEDAKLIEVQSGNDIREEFSIIRRIDILDDVIWLFKQAGPSPKLCKLIVDAAYDLDDMVETDAIEEFSTDEDYYKAVAEKVRTIKQE